MKTFTGQYCAQGDLNIYACDEIPEGLEELKPENGVHILAHSETGHNHELAAESVQVFKQDEFISFCFSADAALYTLLLVAPMRQ